jgi:hypothetical protein
LTIDNAERLRPDASIAHSGEIQRRGSSPSPVAAATIAHRSGALDPCPDGPFGRPFLLTAPVM